MRLPQPTLLSYRENRFSKCFSNAYFFNLTVKSAIPTSFFVIFFDALKTSRSMLYYNIIE